MRERSPGARDRAGRSGSRKDRSRIIFSGGTALAVLLAACGGAAHLRALQPPSPGATSPSTGRATTRTPATGLKPAPQEGIDIDAYTYPGQDVAAAARADIGYARSLGANAVSISFPYFMHSSRADSVYTSARTPTPRQLGAIIGIAREAGMYVSVRPLLDEGSLGKSRTNWKPRQLAAWFASYQRMLIPYARAAGTAGAPEFFLGAEFTRFATAAGWPGLQHAVRNVFHGTIAYANNGSLIERGTVPGAVTTVDAYPALPLGLSTSISQLAAAWYSYDQLLPRGTVITEVGIDAVPGAYREPWRHHWSGQTGVDPAIQYRWFTAACDAVNQAHLGGIYFWQIGLSTRLAGPFSAQGNWAHSAGARAVRNCFRGRHPRHRIPGAPSPAGHSS